MNSTASLSQVLLAQNTSTEELDEWSGTNPLQMLFWSVGAALGGLSVGQWGLLTNMFITVAVQFCASFPLVFLYLSNPSGDVWNETSSFNDTPESNNSFDRISNERCEDHRRSENERPIPQNLFECLRVSSSSSETRSPSTTETSSESNSTESFYTSRDHS
mmetsp:Transcript_23419/g.41213  ORF Transcript_23419/g.41213 Transcript_23419/m.41213 type:complete len:161 (-) Transcript_23419:86-568(-)